MSKPVVNVPGQVHVPLVSKGDITELASVPILGCNGYNGTGKSMAAVLCAMSHLDAGRPVLSTIRLHDWRNPRPCADNQCQYLRHGQPDHLAAHPLWEPFTEWPQLYGLRDGYVLLDEATGVADAREKGTGMPVQINNYLPAMRRKNVFLAWTTIDWRFADARLRRLTGALLWASAVDFAGAGLLRVGPEYLPGEVWPRNRSFLWRLYDAHGIGDDFDPSTGRQGVKMLGRYVYVRARGEAHTAYSTWEEPLVLGAVDEAGLCLCGGLRSRPRCSPERHALLGMQPVSVLGAGEDGQVGGEAGGLLAGVPAPAERAGVRAERRARRHRPDPLPEPYTATEDLDAALPADPVPAA